MAEPRSKSVDAAELASAIGEAIAQSQPPRQVSYAEFIKSRPRKKLLRPTFQNGFPVNPRGLSADTIKRLDALAAGKYIHGKVTVARRTDDDGRKGSIHIFYDMNSPDKRMELMAYFTSLSDLVDRIWREMAATGVEPVQ